MRYLLDTHIFIWSVLSPEKLSHKMISVLENEQHTLYISSMTIWEVLILAEKRKILFNQPVISWINQAIVSLSVQQLAITTDIVIKSRELELPHQDPADRFIAATAVVHDLTLITVDKLLLTSKQVKLL